MVAARCWDAHPESMVVRLVRRDTDTAVDYFEILLDPFHDHRSGYYFAISAAGVLYDAIGFNDGWWDDSWDGVWSGRVGASSSPRRRGHGGRPGDGLDHRDAHPVLAAPLPRPAPSRCGA